MALFKYDKENLVFKKTNKLLKYRLIVAVLSIFLGLTLVSVIKFKSEIIEKEEKIREKERKIELIKSPIREDYYINDLVKSIGHKFTKEEIEEIEKFTTKYKDKVEEAHVPMTLVVWIAYKESRFDHKAKNPNSSASGLFGFIDNTWNSMCKLKGVNKSGRFNKDKQVDILLTYLNYLYNRTGNWESVLKAYHGGTLQYPFNFLIK